MMNGAVWAPLVFLFQFRAGPKGAADRPASARCANAALSGLFLGVSFLSGHHQIPVFIALAWFAIWIWFSFQNRRCGIGWISTMSRDQTLPAAPI